MRSKEEGALGGDVQWEFERDPHLWNSPRRLLRSDGVHKYVEACRLHRVPFLRALLQQLMDLKPKVILQNFNLSVGVVRALAAGMKENHHIVELCLNGCSLGVECIRALCEGLEKNRHLHTLDVSSNPFGGLHESTGANS